MTDHKEYIAALLFEKIAGTISEEDDLIVEEAILNDPEVEREWEAIRIKMATPAAVAFLSGIDPERAWQRAETSIKETPALSVHSGSGYRKWKLAGIAAIIVLALPLAWYFTISRSTTSEESEMLASKQIYLKTEGGELLELSGAKQLNINGTRLDATAEELSYGKSGSAADSRAVTLVVPATKDYKITLSDGTKVWLNASSTLRFPLKFGSGSRMVSLSGEGYFEVTKNPDQEFVVHTENADVRVHGTSFNVNTYGGKQFSAALVEGSVSALKDGKLLKLKPGERAVLSMQSLHMEPFDRTEVLSWMNGTYVFHRQTLAEIAPVISRWFDVRVNWESDAIANQTFTGEIDKKLSLAVVLSNLQLSSGIKAELKNGVLTFK